MEATVKKQQHTVTISLAFATTVLLVTAILITNLMRRKRKRVQHKKQLLKDLVCEYDYQILQLMIMKVQSDELKARLKRNFDLDDNDFTRD